MADFARSEDPAVQRQLERLAALSPGADILGLERIAVLMDRLGHPELELPPVVHIAGTNGKGSTSRSSAPPPRPPASRRMSTPARTWSASTSASASPAP